MSILNAIFGYNSITQTSKICLNVEYDFVIQRGVEIDRLIQVTWNMGDEETRRREINELIEASEVTGCQNLFIITAEDSEEVKLDDGKVIYVLPAWRWLLEG